MNIYRHRIVEIFKKSATNKSKSSQEMNFKGFKIALIKMAQDYYMDKIIDAQNQLNN